MGSESGGSRLCPSRTSRSRVASKTPFLYHHAISFNPLRLIPQGAGHSRGPKKSASLSRSRETATAIYG